jgi:hypothetical protein
MHAVETDKFARQGKAKHLFIAVFRCTVGFQGTRAYRKQAAALFTGAKDVLPGLVRVLTFYNLVEFMDVIAAHALREAQLGQTADTAGNLDISNLQRFAFGWHSG